jgi:uncharacterized protein YbjT (DUF2867 family)
MKLAVAGGTGAVGRHVVDRARELGHDPVVLTRSAGHDLLTGDGLATALAGVDAVIDVASVQTQSAAKSREFFGTITRNLLAAESAAGVGHHLALSIIGVDRAPYAYYAGKALQEQLVESGDVPWTILRATQFFEFAGQLLGQTAFGPVALVPTTRSQPVAAREVAIRLVELATGAPAGRARDLAGPREENMADLARRWLKANGKATRVIQFPLPGGFGRALRDGTLLPAPGTADLSAVTVDDWLAAEVRRPR